MTSSASAADQPCRIETESLPVGHLWPWRAAPMGGEWQALDWRWERDSRDLTLCRPLASIDTVGMISVLDAWQ